MENRHKLYKAALALEALKAGRYVERYETTPLEALADWAAAAHLKPEYVVLPRDIVEVLLEATWGEEEAMLRIDEIRDILLAALGEGEEPNQE